MNTNIKTKGTQHKPSFSAGMSSKIAKEIQNVDPVMISKTLAKKGISTEFDNNQTIAWCCNKVVEIFEYLNQKHNTNLALPNGIIVTDFEKLNMENKKAYGFCNLRPYEMFNNSDRVVPSRVLFFNNFKSLTNNISEEKRLVYNWDNIDAISDFGFIMNRTPTDFFLDVFFHEFAHSAHETRLLNKLGAKKLAEKFDILDTKESLNQYRAKYGDRIKGICGYALNSPLEAVACDVSKTISKSMEKDFNFPKTNPFIDTPYERLFFWQPKRIKIPVYTDEERPLKEILRNFWNGVFD